MITSAELLPQDRSVVVAEQPNSGSVAEERAHFAPRLGWATPHRSAGDVRLVAAYLSAIATELSRRAFVVRAIAPYRTDRVMLAGTLTLEYLPGNRSTWMPTRLRWAEDSGWSAILTYGREDRPAESVRYLPTQHAVPPAGVVAHFAAALRADPSTGWAPATLRRPKIVDHRVVMLELRRYG